MTISPERLANACKAWGPWSEREDLTRLILAADDAWRASQLNPELEASRAKAIMAGQDDAEPMLPSGIRHHEHDDHRYKKSHDSISYVWIHYDWTPEELEAVAQHMRWKSRAAEREAQIRQEIRDAEREREAAEPVEVPLFDRLKDHLHGRFGGVEAQKIAEAIVMALDAQRKGQK